MGIGAAIIGGVASIAGGIIGSSGASRAAEAQVESSGAAIAEQRAAREEARSDFAPWREAGVSGLEQLQQELGLTGEGRPSAEGPYVGEEDATYAGGLEEFYSSDVYQFPLQEGLRAIQGTAAARGVLRSGGTLQGLTEYAQGVAGQAEGTFYNRRQDYLNRAQAAESRVYDRQQDYLNRLGGLAGLGQTAVSQTAALGQASSQQIGGLLQQAGAARATGIQGQASAFGNALGGVGTAIGSIIGQS